MAIVKPGPVSKAKGGGLGAAIAGAVAGAPVGIGGVVSLPPDAPIWAYFAWALLPSIGTAITAAIGGAAGAYRAPANTS